ncbi:hypothetical protein BKA65DRAFT_72813 [Rhexocercosporidium sp. MPI-PUGE-AT-0058]|nr:hypothetical protein BKA65DRAFT_72813 [Rhexocercosporidium sp. MPI-PUGE-AT-0058]
MTRGLWGALGGLFTVVFTPPAISLESLRHDDWKVHFTVSNVFFGLFWAMAFLIATVNGVWPRLWEQLLVDANTFCYYGPWACDRIWVVLASILGAVLSGWSLKYLYEKHLHKVEPIRNIIAGITSSFEFAYSTKTIAQLVDIIPVFIKQLSMNYFLFRTRDDDGEIMVIGTLDENTESKKCKPKLGVPKSIKIKQQQAMEFAQAGVGQSNGSIGKASGLVKKEKVMGQWNWH